MPNLPFRLLALLTLALPGAAAAISDDELLPIEQAFALTAEAEERGRIVFRFEIAEGYYLYRHRMAVAGPGGTFKADPLQMPSGEAKHDEFFGDTEIYRDAVTLVQTGAAADGVETLQFEVRYQGCADIGVCYPPHRQMVEVALPAAPAAASVTSSLPTGPSALPGLPVTPSTSPLSGAKPAPIVGLPGRAMEADAGTDALPLPPEEAFAFEAIADGPSSLLLRFTPAPGYYLYRDRSAFTLREANGVALGEPRWPPGVAHADEHFGEVIVYFDQVELPIALSRVTRPAQEVLLEATFQGCQDDGICYPPMTRTLRIALPEAPPEALATTLPPARGAGGNGAAAASGVDGTGEATVAAGTDDRSTFSASGLLLALLLALLGGMVLNLMPCVLPVLSLKAIGLAQGANDAAAGRRHALWYTAGVLASFAAVGVLVLALRAGGAALGWGFQLQQPVVLAVLVYVMLAIGLSLSGVFQIGAGLAGLGDGLTRRSGPSGDFFTGVLAVVVASPCTAPFMGSALAFAFAAPPLSALLVFLALGLGLALPFLLIGFVPALARRLPRPGAWMDTFKQLMAFPMYLTAVWLVWVLARLRGPDAVALVLLGATLLALTVWWRERARDRSLPARLAVAGLLAVALLPLAGIALLERPAAAGSVTADGAVPFSPTRLAELRRGNRPLFVNFTADWCITCKANERLVLSGDGFREAMARHDAVYVKGDWTDVDADISAFLDAHGAVGVPFYIVYPADGGEGEILPTVLTLEVVAGALARASAPAPSESSRASAPAPSESSRASAPAPATASR